MKFGRVANLKNIDFTLPKDHPSTSIVLQNDPTVKPDIFIGYPSWSKANFKGFYPKGTKDELVYYSTKFNAIELNATFYRIFSPEQFEKWHDKTTENFKFFPKLNQEISHWKRLNETKDVVDYFLQSALSLKNKLGCLFLQLPNNFTSKDYGKLYEFISNWPKSIPLAIELRHSSWFTDSVLTNEVFQIMENHNISNIIVDSPGRRDIMHMRLTNSRAFIRFVAGNHSVDYERLDAWIERIVQWKNYGIKHINFFIHQDVTSSSNLLSSYLIDRINSKLDLNLPTVFVEKLNL